MVLSVKRRTPPLLLRVKEEQSVSAASLRTDGTEGDTLGGIICQPDASVL